MKIVDYTTSVVDGGTQSLQDIELVPLSPELSKWDRGGKERDGCVDVVSRR